MGAVNSRHTALSAQGGRDGEGGTSRKSGHPGGCQGGSALKRGGEKIPQTVRGPDGMHDTPASNPLPLPVQFGMIPITPLSTYLQLLFDICTETIIVLCNLLFSLIQSWISL